MQVYHSRVTTLSVVCVQKTNLIRDYLEYVNSQPKPRRRWPREVWVKYADKLEVFSYFHALEFHFCTRLFAILGVIVL
jgi:hypothetical protein